MGRNNKRKRKNGRPQGSARSVRRPSLTGRVQLHEHSAYVITDEGDFKVMGRGKREVMDGDTVAISIKQGPQGDRRALIESVIERAATSIVGSYTQAGPLGVIEPLDSRLHADFFIVPEDTSAERLGVHEDDVVVARILSYPTRLESGIVTIERRIGDEHAPDLGVQYVMARYGYTDTYPQAALDEAAELALDVDSALKDPLRRDLRDRFIITIDPVDARDFDDAISLERTPAGGYRLGVHIADVSHYVAWDSRIDLEARRRTTSVYLADRVLPMLPERLSNDLCSLRPNEDRLAFTVDIELDAQGRVQAYDPYPSVISSRVRMDYDGAEALLARAGVLELPVVDGAPEDVATVEESRAAALERGEACAETAQALGVDLADFLAAAHELAEKRRAIRRARGSVDFDTAEVRALLDEDGRPVQIVARERSAATSLIEEAMLLANECVAEWLADRDIDACYRVHDAPSPDSLHGAAVALSELGIIDVYRAGGIELGDPDALQAAVDETRGSAVAPLVNTLLLRSMQRALYKPQNAGHFALGAQAYCHFTSPIRRYPDLVVHRILKLQLAHERLGAKDALARTPRLIGKGGESLPRILPQICRACSDAERAADAASHATQKIKIAQYFEDRIGERYAGTVSWVSEMGVFVRLDLTQVEGLAGIKTLGHEWFQFDEDALTLTGADTGMRIELGMRAIVEIARVNTTRGHLDFKLIHVG